MLGVTTFLGEIPRISPRLLPDGYAVQSINAKLERGCLTPFRRPVLRETLTTDAKTIYRNEDGSWLSWNDDVDVVPGPVASDRLYITGDGVPKVKVGTTIYNLAVPFPGTARPTAFLRGMNEWITIDGSEILLAHGGATTTVNGLAVQVSVRNNTAVISITTAAGMPTASAQNLIDGLRYRAAGTALVSGVKVAKITRIQDNGGQTYDANRNPLGSDSRQMDDVGTVISVTGTAGAPQSYTLAPASAQDSTNVGAQNDPPTLTTTGLDPIYAAGDAAVALFDDTAIGTVEAAQTIIRVDLSIDGLANNQIDAATQENLVYAYTWVTSLGEESRPSRLSRQTPWSPGQNIRLTGFATPPGGRGIARMRIYRSATSTAGVTDLYLIGDVPVGTTLFDDTVDVLPLQEPLPSLEWDPPVDTLSGLIAMPNGMMAGFSGKEVFFCEPYRPHAWPSKYAVMVDAAVVGLVAFGSTVAVLTNRHPHILQGTHPSSMTAEKAEVDLPCLAKKSIVDMGYFGAYASTEGIVTIDNSGARLVSDKLWTQEQWRLLGPGSFVSGQASGRYVFSYDGPGAPVQRRCGVVDLTGDQPYLIETNWTADSFFFHKGLGNLFFLDGARAIYEFDAPSGPFAVARWRSKPFVHPGLTSYARIRIDANTVNGSTFEVRIHADGRQVAQVSAKNRIVTLPALRLARVYEVEIITDFEVYGVWLGQSVAELAMAAA